MMPSTPASPGQPDAVPPAIALQRLLAGTWISSAISVTARLGIADLLADGARTTTDLAEATGSHAPSLARLLGTLASVGLFRLSDDGLVALTPLAEPLRSDVPGSVHAFAVMLGEEWHWRAWGTLDHSIQTGQSAFEHLYGMTGFEYWTEYPEAGAVFDAAMTSRSADENRAVLAAFDFSRFTTVADVGGGHGSLIIAILKRYPQLHGLLVDLPHVVAGATEQLRAAGLVKRCQVVGGDFFTSVTAGADAYLMKKIIHDWDDDRAVTILRSCHQAMPVDGRLLLVELVLPADNEASFARLLDLLMLVWSAGGKERTAAEHEALLARAGFDLVSITPTASPVHVIEAQPQRRGDCA